MGTSVTVTLSAGTKSSNLSVIYTSPDGIPSIVGTLVTDSLGNGSTTVTIPMSSTTATTGNNGVIAVDGKTKNFVVIAAPLAVTVTDGLSTIAGKYSIVWAFDAATQEWKLYDTAPGAVSTLTSLTKGQGYWMQVTEDCTIVYGGNPYSLTKGWNLIGWLG